MPTVLIEVISRYHDSDKPTYKALLDIPEGGPWRQSGDITGIISRRPTRSGKSP